MREPIAVLRATREAVQPSLWDRLVNDLPGVASEIAGLRETLARELGEERKSPTQDEEFVLSHSDNVESSGFVQHLTLPHYVDFQSELVLVRDLRAAHGSTVPR